MCSLPQQEIVVSGRRKEDRRKQRDVVNFVYCGHFEVSKDVSDHGLGFSQCELVADTVPGTG